jgi:hypothetical protein
VGAARSPRDPSAPGPVTDDAPVSTDALRRLYTTPPSEFVAARTALVKERRQAGDRTGATALAALRKPSAVDWALNVAAVDEPDEIEAFLDAAARVREAQTAAAEGRGTSGGRDALREMRAQAARVVALADKVAAGKGGARGALVAAATARLAGLVANADAADQLRAAQLGSSALDAVDPFAAFELPAPAGPPPPKQRPAETGRAAAPKRPNAKEQAKRRRLEEAVAKAEHAHATAQKRLEALDGQLDEASDAVVAAEEHLEQRRDAAAETATAREEAAERLSRTEEAVGAARAALED